MMEPHHRTSYGHASIAQHDFLRAVGAAEHRIRARVPSVGEYVLLSLLWGFVLYLILSAAE